jgi:hypothetical protein
LNLKGYLSGPPCVEIEIASRQTKPVMGGARHKKQWCRKLRNTARCWLRLCDGVEKSTGEKKAAQRAAERLEVVRKACLARRRPASWGLARGEVEQPDALLRRPSDRGAAPANTRAADDRLPCLQIEFCALQ